MLSHKISIFLLFLLIALSPRVVKSQLIADFAVSDTASCGSLQVSFFDQSSLSSGTITDWEWELGSVFSSKQNPGAIFTEPGSFTICLTVTDNNGNTAKTCKDSLINIFGLPNPDFSIDNTDGCSPMRVTISDLTQSTNGGIAKWIWDLGGTANVITTSDPNRAITTIYENEGVYSMNLTVEDKKGCVNTIQRKDIVKVDEGPELDLDYEVLSSCGYPWQVAFTNLSIDPEVTYLWDFGNGKTFEGAYPPVIFYGEAGVFDVTVILQKGACSSEFILENYIDTDRDNEIVLKTSSNCVGTRVELEDASVVVADSILWHFGNGQTSIESSTSVFYDTAGCYDIELLRYRGDCTDTVRTQQCILIDEEAKINYEIKNQFACELPTTVTLLGTTESKGDFIWTIKTPNGETDYSGDSIDVEFSEYGKYKVDIKYTDSTGCFYLIEDVELEVAEYEVNLPFRGFGGCIPMNVQMLDSVNTNVPIASWKWNVFNSNRELLHTSDDRAPSFEITEIGKYDVQLIVENILGCVDTVYRRGFIEAGIPVEIDFEAVPLESCIIETKNFYDLGDPRLNGWFWNFGDSTFSDLQNPEKTYSNPGSYDVRLTGFYNGCPSQEYKPLYIGILTPRSAFSINYRCDDPYTVDIINATIGADSLAWMINLGDRDTVIYDSILPSITFPGRGKYPISHFAFNDSTLCEHIASDTIRILDPVAQFVIDTMVGCAPLNISVADHSIDATRYLFTGEGATITRDTFYNPEFTYSTPGTFPAPMLRIIDNHGCRDSIQIQDSIVVNGIEAEIDFSDIVCVPAEFNPVSISKDTYGKIISYEWSINQGAWISQDSSPTFFISEPGVYDISLKVKDDFNCEDFIEYSMAIEGIDINPDFTADTLSCTWSEVRFRAKNTTENIDSISWDLGDGTFSNEKNLNHIYSQEGEYTICLSYRDKRGCITTICKEKYVVIKDPVAEFSGDPIKADCPPLLSNFTNLSNNGSSYLWNFGDNTGTSNNESPSKVFTEPGSYNVSLEVSLTPTCKDTIIKENFIILEGPRGNFTQVTDSMCLPLTVTLNAESDDFYTYIWDFGNGVIDSVESISVENETVYVYEEVGSYIPKIIIVDEAGCKRAIAGDRIIVNDLKPGFTVSDSSFCNTPADIEIINTTTSSSEKINFFWEIYGPQRVTSSEENPVLRMDSLGIYSIGLISNSENCVDTFIQEKIVEITKDPVVDFDIINNQLCESVEVVFQNKTTVEGGFLMDYIWDFGDGNTSTEANPSHLYSSLEARTVTLTAITSKGCSSMTSMDLPILPSTVARVSPSDTICIGDQITFSGTIENLQVGGSFYWENIPENQCVDCLEFTLSPTQTETYILVGVHPNGCISADSVTITVIPTPGPQLELSGVSDICSGDKALLTVDNYNEAYTYFWKDENNTLDCYINCDSLYASPGTNAFYAVVVFNEYGCYARDTLSVNVELSIGEILTDDKTICLGNKTTLSVENGAVMRWESEGQNLCNINCEVLQIQPETRQRYMVEVQSVLGCMYLDSIDVNVVSPSDVQVSPDSTICIGETITLLGEGFGSPSWILNEDILSEESDMQRVSPVQSGTYIYRSSADECVLEDSIIITVFSKAAIEGIGDTICPGETAILSAFPEIADFYYWEHEEIENIMNAADISVSHRTTEIYKLISEFRICEPDTAYVEVFVHPEIDGDIQKTFVKYSNLELSLDYNFDPSSNYSFLWTPGEGLSCNDCPAPSLIDVEENRKYELQVTDENSGCSIVKEVFVRYERECSSNAFQVANIFSPNQDGINDQFQIHALDETEFRRVHIIDRWGNKVYYSEDISGTWDGTFNGAALLPGVFVLRIDAFCSATSEEYFILEDVTIVR